MIPAVGIGNVSREKARIGKIVCSGHSTAFRGTNFLRGIAEGCKERNRENRHNSCDQSWSAKKQADLKVRNGGSGGGFLGLTGELKAFNQN